MAKKKQEYPEEIAGGIYGMFEPRFTAQKIEEVLGVSKSVQKKMSASGFVSTIEEDGFSEYDDRSIVLFTIRYEILRKGWYGRRFEKEFGKFCLWYSKKPWKELQNFVFYFFENGMAFSVIPKKIFGDHIWTNTKKGMQLFRSKEKLLDLKTSDYVPNRKSKQKEVVANYKDFVRREEIRLVEEFESSKAKNDGMPETQTLLLVKKLKQKRMSNMLVNQQIFKLRPGNQEFLFEDMAVAKRLKLYEKRNNQYFVSCEQYQVFRLYQEMGKDSIPLLKELREYYLESPIYMGNTGMTVIGNCLLLMDSEREFMIGKTFFKEDGFSTLRKLGSCVKVIEQFGF